MIRVPNQLKGSKLDVQKMLKDIKNKKIEGPNCNLSFHCATLTSKAPAWAQPVLKMR